MIDLGGVSVKRRGWFAYLLNSGISPLEPNKNRFRPISELKTRTFRDLRPVEAGLLQSLLHALHEFEESIFATNGVQFRIAVGPVPV